MKTNSPNNEPRNGKHSTWTRRAGIRYEKKRCLRCNKLRKMPWNNFICGVCHCANREEYVRPTYSPVVASIKTYL